MALGHTYKMLLLFNWPASAKSTRRVTMSDTVLLSHSLRLAGQITHSSHKLDFPTINSLSFPRKYMFSTDKNRVFGGKIGAIEVRSDEGSLQEMDDSSPVSIELEPICGENEFDQVITEARQRQESVIVVWVASWCRKCIYLKPKLEKLAAEYYQRLRFYSINVNTVPFKLVTRAGVTKMPTIQLWRDGEKHGEVIGGHTGHLVVNEVRQMIETESTK